MAADNQTLVQEIIVLIYTIGFNDFQNPYLRWNGPSRSLETSIQYCFQQNPRRATLNNYEVSAAQDNTSQSGRSVSRTGCPEFM